MLANLSVESSMTAGLMNSPYEGLPPRSFWRTGAAGPEGPTFDTLYRKRFEITPQTRIATAGSCFAQHISRALRERGYSLVDVEPAPPGLEGDAGQRYGYGLYSARYGNIYTVRQLVQLVREAIGKVSPQDVVWRKEDRYFDAFRPGVEPNGLKRPETVQMHRQEHLACVRDLLKRTEVFIFTLGLTEAWVHAPSGLAYPTAPGTIAGEFDPQVYVFKNFTFAEIVADFLTFRAMVRIRNPTAKFLLTVSPVPLTATATDNHVLSATTYSKAVLRAAAGQLSDEHEDIDYFPAFEIIAGQASRGRYFEPNLRSVSAEGVDLVMRTFFNAHGAPDELPPASRPAEEAEAGDDDVICEDALLEAFNP